MINIAVCDDEIIYAERISCLLDEIFNNMNMSAHITTYSKSQDFWLDINEKQFDAIFLDIDMPKPNGFHIAEKIRQISFESFIIFVSAKQELVFDSLDYHPFGFVRKEVGGSLYSSLKKVSESLSDHFRQSKIIQINEAYRGPTTVPIKDILYIRSDNHHLYYKLKDKSSPLRERTSMTIRCEELDDCGFIRPHNRYLVNVSHIEFFSPKVNKITLDNKEIIPVSSGNHSTSHEKYLLLKRKY